MDKKLVQSTEEQDGQAKYIDDRIWIGLLVFYRSSLQINEIHRF